MLDVVRGRRGPRPVSTALRALTVALLLVLGLPTPSAFAALVGPAVTEAYGTPGDPTPLSQPSSDTTPVFTVDLDGGDGGLHCWFGQGAPPEPGTGSWDLCAGVGSSPVEVAVTTAGDGAWTFAAAAFDGVDTYGPVVTRSYVLDTTKPAVVVPDLGQGADESLVWTVTVTDASATTRTCSLTGPGGATATVTGCATSPTADLTGEPEGTWTLSVDVVDAAGNATAGTTSTYVLDRVPGAVTVTATPAVGSGGPGREAVFDVDLPTAPAGDPAYAVLCEVSSTAATAPAAPACDATTDQVRLALPDQDAAVTLKVTVTDASGSSTDDSAVFALDRTPPVVSVGAPTPSGSGQASSLSWTWTVTDANPGTTTCVLVRDTTVRTAVTCSGGAVTTPLPQDGRYALEVTATDLAGLPSAPATSAGTYLRDTDAPTASLTLPASPSQTAALVGATAGADDPAATLSCEVTHDGAAFAALPGCTGLDGLALGEDGTYAVTVTATDDGQSDKATGTYVLDRRAPDPVDVTEPATPTRDTAATWSLSPAAPGDTRTCRFRVDGSSPAFTACPSPLTFPSATNGSWVLEVRDVDQAANATTTVATPVVLDTVAPSAPVFVTPLPATGSQASHAVALAHGTPLPGTSFRCRLLGPTPESSQDWAACATPRSVPFPVEGSYVLEVRSVDDAGNESASASSAYVRDVTAPGPASVSGPSGTSNDTSITWSFTPDPALTGDDPVRAVCERRLDGAVVQTVDPCPTTLAYDPLTGQGEHRLDVTLYDAAGNPSTVASSPTYLLDTIAPAAPTVSAVTGPSPSRTPTLSWTISGEAPPSPGRVECLLVTNTVPDPAGWQTCTSPRTYTSVADGSYVLRARVVDAALNTGAIGSSAAYVVDTGDPVVPTFPGAPTGPSQSRSASWTVDTEDGTSLTCRLQRAGDPAAPFLPCTSPYAASSLVDGSWVLTVTSEDAAGNASTGSSPAYVVDNAGPLAPLVSGPTGKSNQPAVSWTWTGETSTTSRCRVLDGTTVWQGWATCTSPQAATLPGDGDWVLEVELTDQAGNPGAVGTSPVYRLKTSVPGAPDVAGPTGPSNDLAPVWEIKTDNGTTTECRLVRNGAAGPWSGCGTPHSRDLTGMGSASYVLEARASDGFGNTSPVGASGPYLLDVVRPVAPVVSGPEGPSQDASPRWTWTAEAGAASCQLRRDGAVVVAWTACASGYQPTLASDGTWLLEVRITDTAGNVGDTGRSPEHELDRVAPPAPVATDPSGPTRVPSATWALPSLATGDTRSCRVTLDGAAFTAFAPCGTALGPVTLGSDGTYRVEAVDTDRAGNASEVGRSAGLVLDTAAPGAPGVTGPSGAGQATAVTWTATGVDADAVLQCRLERDGGWSTDFADCASPYSRTLTTDGSHVLRVRARDAAGNTSAEVPSAAYLLDRLAPVAPGVTGPEGDSDVAAVRWRVTAEAGAAVTCVLRRGGSPVETISPCGVVDRTLGVDGTWTLTATATDAAGNTSGTGTSPDYRFDATDPIAPVVTGATGPTATTTMTWSVTGEAGRLECRLTRDGVVVEDWAGPCAVPVVRASTGDGGYRLDARVVDAAGNVGAVGSSPVLVVDTAAPRVPVVSGGSLPSRVATATWTVDAEASTTQRCRLVLGGAPHDAFGDCGTTVTRTLPADGDWQLEVVSYDGARNPSAPGLSPVYPLDTTAPAAPAVTGPTGTGNATGVTYGFAVPSAHTASCVLTRDGTPAVELTSCTSPLPRVLGADGSWVLEVRVTDPAGNTGPAGRSPAYLLDTAAPAALVVTGPTGPSRTLSATWALTGEAASASCRVVRGAVVVVEPTSCLASFSVDLTGQPDGGYVLEATATDVAGNTGPTGTSAPYVVDTTAPAAPVVSGPSGPSPLAAPVFSWTGEAGTTATCRYLQAGSTTAPVAARCTSPTTAALTADGSWVLEVALTDAAGNTSPAGSSAAYVLDTVAPVAPVVTPPAPVGRDRMPTWGVVAEVGATLECRLTGPSLVRDWTACTAPYDTELAGQPDGAYVLSVRATDAAGLTGAAGSGTYVLDTVAPAAPSVTVPATGSSRSPRFAFTSEAGTTATCRTFRGATLLNTLADCTSPPTVDLTGQPDGPYSLNVRLTDAAGNTGFGGSATYVLDTRAPAAPSFTQVPASPSPERQPVWGFTVEQGATPSCELRFPTGAVRVITGCASPLPVDLTTVPAGRYELVVRATDPAGSTSPAAVSAYVLDPNAPGVATVVAPASPSRDGAPVWHLGVPPGALAQCRLFAPGAVDGTWGPCDSASTHQAPLFGQPGAWELQVRAVVAGLPGPAASATYVYDPVPPAPPVVVAPFSPSTVVSPSFTISSPEAAVSASCELRGPAVTPGFVACPVSPAGSVYRVTVPGGGSYELAVRLTDAAGNTSGETRVTYVVALTTPDAVTITGPSGYGSDPSPVWTFSEQPGTTLECRLTGPDGTDVVPLQVCGASLAADLGDTGDGSYGLTVRAVSAAGVAGPDASLSYQLLQALPPAPVNLQGPSGKGSDRGPRWTFTLLEGAVSARCVVVSSLAPDRPFREAACDDDVPFALDLAQAPAATYVLTVMAVGPSGLTSTGNPSTSYELETEVPAEPRFTVEPGSPSSATDPTWWFASTADLVECRLLRGGVALEDFQACKGNETYTALLATQPDGTYTLQVRGVNTVGAGPAASSSYAFDRSAVPSPRITGVPVSPSNDTTPTWSFAVPTGHTAQCLVRPSGTATPCGPSFTPSLGAADEGTVEVAIALVDATGRVGVPATGRYVLDVTAPAPVVLSPVPSPGNVADVQWTWTGGTAPDTSGCALTRPASQRDPEVECQAPWDMRATADGTYLVAVRAHDVAGNASAEATGTYVYDTVAPVAPRVVAPVSPGTDSTPTWTFAVPAGVTATCSTMLGKRELATEDCTDGRYDMALAAAGDYTLKVVLVDAAGNDRSYTHPTGYTYREAATTLPPSPVVNPPVVRPRPPVVIDEPGPGGGRPSAPAPTGDGTGPVPSGDPVPPRALPPLAAPGGDGGTRTPSAIGVPRGVQPLGQVPEAIAEAVTETFKKPQLPLALLVVVVLFLLVQNRIDRRDPKLAGSAPLPDDDLTFGPSFRPGGAPA